MKGVQRIMSLSSSRAIQLVTSTILSQTISRSKQRFTCSFCTAQQTIKSVSVPPRSEVFSRNPPKFSQPRSKEVLSLTVKKDEQDMRLDRFLQKRYPSLPHNLVQKMIRQKKVSISKYQSTADKDVSVLLEETKRLDSSDRMQSGQIVRIPAYLVEHAPAEQKLKSKQKDFVRAQSMVVYKDSSIIVLNKPSGLACQGGTKIKDHVDKLLPYLKFEYDEKPRLIHRLDKDTSGVLILGRTRQSTQYFQQLFEEGKIKKTYWAFLVGDPSKAFKDNRKHGTVSVALKKLMNNGEEKVVVTTKLTENSKMSVTDWRILNKHKWGSFVELQPHTGRTHQLRVICASVLEAPIFGDAKYYTGNTTPHSSLLGLHYDKPLLHLHARKLFFTHPDTKKDMTIEMPLPQHFADTLEHCEVSY